MEYLLFEILYRGLNYEKMRTTKYIKRKQIIELRKHMALLKMVLHLVNAIYYKLGNDYCKTIKNKIVSIIKNNSEYELKYYNSLLVEDNFEPNSCCERVLKLLNYIFAVIDLDLSDEKTDISHLHMLFRAAHNLPRCMLKKGYLDKSYIQDVSEDECIDYALSNMDQELEDRIFNLI